MPPRLGPSNTPPDTFTLSNCPQYMTPRSRPVQHPDVIARAVVLGVEHELHLLGGRPAHIEADAVEGKAVSRLAAVRLGMGEARPDARADADRRERRVLGVERSGGNEQRRGEQ